MSEGVIDMAEKEITIHSPKGDIYAVFTPGAEQSVSSGVTSGNESLPVVILCHGLMMNCGQNPILGVSEIFNQAGYDTLRFDFRGSGRSSGKITEMTPLTEVDDLMSVISFVREKGRRIVLCGHSLGGLVSLITASRLADSVEAMVLLAPAVNIEMDSKAGRVADVHFDPVNIPDEVEVWGSRLSRQYFITAQNLNTFDVISHYSGPVCIMMGDRDRIVELNLSDDILRALPQAELHTMEHGDHLFSRGVRLRAGNIAVDFCDRYFQYS